MTEKVQWYAILDSKRSKYERYLGETVFFCRSKEEIKKVYAERFPCLTWVSYSSKYTDALLKIASRFRENKAHLSIQRGNCLLTIIPPRSESGPSLQGLFPQVLGNNPNYHWLAQEKLAEALLNPSGDRSELFLAAAADPVSRTLSFIRGDCEQVVVPFSLFKPGGDGLQPDFSNPQPADYGLTLVLGPYEAAVDAILYETDVKYRKKQKQQREENDRSFGAALLRLRKQVGLGRADFVPLSAKTIARLERNEIGRPQGKTLRTLAHRLGVPPEEIATY